MPVVLAMFMTGPTACSSVSGPLVTGTYSLTGINGQALPAVMDAFTTLDGRRFEFVAVRGTMTFRWDGSFAQTTEARRVIVGVVGDSILPGLIKGKFHRADTATVILRFRHINQGTPYELTYQVFEEGRVLRGVQDFRMYEWVRD